MFLYCAAFGSELQLRRASLVLWGPGVSPGRATHLPVLYSAARPLPPAGEAGGTPPRVLFPWPPPVRSAPTATRRQASTAAPNGSAHRHDYTRPNLELSAYHFFSSTLPPLLKNICAIHATFPFSQLIPTQVFVMVMSLSSIKRERELGSRCADAAGSSALPHPAGPPAPLPSAPTPPGGQQRTPPPAMCSEMAPEGTPLHRDS